MNWGQTVSSLIRSWYETFSNLTVSFISPAFYLILQNYILHFSNLLFSLLNTCLISLIRAVISCVLSWHFFFFFALLLSFTVLTGQLPVLTHGCEDFLCFSQRKVVYPSLSAFLVLAQWQKDGSEQLHKRKKPEGGTVENLVWWLATRQNEAVHFWWFQF